MPKDKNIKVEREEHKKLRKAFGYDTTYELPTKGYKEWLSKLKRGGDKINENEKV